jgi:hypothetical protein
MPHPAILSLSTQLGEPGIDMNPPIFLAGEE